MIQIRSLICGSYQANAYLLWQDSRDDLLVIDPGDDLAALETQIRLTGKRLTDIVLTHGHFDHMLCAAPLKEKFGARIHVHPADSFMLQYAGLSLYDTNVCRQPFRSVQPDSLLPESETFSLTLCGTAFDGLHTPGHTPGSVTLICSEADAVFTGDTIFAHGYGRYDFPGGNLCQLTQSLRTLLDLPERFTVYSGHGEADGMAAIAARWRRK